MINLLSVKINHRFFNDSGGTQTHSLLIRSQMLYSVELRSTFILQNYKKIINKQIDFILWFNLFLRNLQIKKVSSNSEKIF